jgi:hypothetical protein
MKLTRIFALLVVSIFFGCKDNTVTVQVHDLGTYRGKVAQYGADGNLASDQSGATISVEGTTFKGTTDASGNFQIDNVPAGIYNLLISKMGYDTDLVSQNQFSGSGTQFLQNEQIHKIAWDSILISNIDIRRTDSLSYRDTNYGVHVAVTCMNIGPDSLIRCTIEARDLRSNEGFLIARYSDTIPAITSRQFTREITVYSYDSRNRPALYRSGDSILITTQAYTKAPYGIGGLPSPYKVSRIAILP